MRNAHYVRVSVYGFCIVRQMNRFVSCCPFTFYESPLLFLSLFLSLCKYFYYFDINWEYRLNLYTRYVGIWLRLSYCTRTYEKENKSSCNQLVDRLRNSLISGSFHSLFRLLISFFLNVFIVSSLFVTSMLDTIEQSYHERALYCLKFVARLIRNAFGWHAIYLTNLSVSRSFVLPSWMSLNFTQWTMPFHFVSNEFVSRYN